MWPGHETDHWPPSAAEVNNEWSCTCPSCICLHGKHRDGFYMSINCLFNEEITECAAFVVSLLTSVNLVLTYLSA
jgi:hypothetical protein